MIHGAGFRHCLGWAITFLLLLPGHAWALAWQFEVADRSDSIYTSLALDSQGRPHISHFDVGNQRLKHTRFDGQVWRSEVVDGRPDDGAGAYSALALDSQDRPHISYFYSPTDSIAHLRYARFDGAAWRIETVDTSGGGFTSIALDSQGRPHISYCDCRNRALKYARWDGTAWQVQTVDTGVGGFTSLKLDAQGRPHISYSGGRRLRYARWDGVAWRLETVEDLGQRCCIEWTSLVLDGEGRPQIAYTGAGGLTHARWDGSAWRLEVADPDGGSYASLGLDSARRPLISYHTVDFEPFPPARFLKLARFDGLGWQSETLESGGFGTHTSLKVDTQDRVHISYNVEVPGTLKYALGAPWVRLDLQLNRPSFRSGETLALAATVTPGAVPLTADAYVAVGLPGGSLLFLQGDGSFTPDVLPLVRNWSVTSFTGELVRYTFGGSEPAGPYTWFAAFTAPGTLTLIESLVSVPFSFTP